MPLVRQYVKQTNHCKLTMVWCEDDISFLFALLQRSRDYWRDHVTVCSVITSKALVEKPLYWRERSSRSCRVHTRFLGEILVDVEDGGKSWSREGQEEEVSLK